MTREEAIKELKEDIELYIPLHETIDDVDRDLPDGRLITSLEMAIKALEQEPCDAISRQAAIECCRNEWEEEVETRLKSLPPVNPQPKTGRWEKKEDEICWWWVCSKCGEEPLDNKYNGQDNLSAYCPHCGAKMVEPQESEGTDAL